MLFRSTRQLLVRHSSGNCHFGENVPCYAISNNSKIQVGSKSLDFVWVGKFISRKDPLFALEVARFIVQKRKESKFAFFGGGQLRKKLENRILGYNLADNVSIHSWVSKQEILNQISSANCLLFSSTRETTGNQLLEALNLGTPVIALDASGASSWLKSNRIIWKSPKISQSRINFAKEIADTYLTNILDAKSPNIEENFSSEQLLSHLLRDYG